MKNIVDEVLKQYQRNCDKKVRANQSVYEPWDYETVPMDLKHIKFDKGYIFHTDDLFVVYHINKGCLNIDVFENREEFDEEYLEYVGWVVTNLYFEHTSPFNDNEEFLLYYILFDVKNLQTLINDYTYTRQEYYQTYRAGNLDILPMYLEMIKNG